jgi:hypothetical protein
METETVGAGPKKKRELSPEQKEKMASARKAYWEKRKREVAVVQAKAQIQEAIAEKEDKGINGDIKFFGEIDLNQYGKIGSDYPTWYYPRQIESLKEELGRMERELSGGTVLPQNVPNLKFLIKQTKDKVDKIESSRPKLNGKTVDKLSKWRREIEPAIQDSQFTYDDMKRGTADAHEEARRMTEGIITVDPEIARACNLRPDRNGKYSRNETVKAWKITGRALQEATHWGRKDQCRSFKET